MFDQIVAHAIIASFLDWNLAAKFDLITSQQSNPLISSVGNDGDRDLLNAFYGALCPPLISSLVLFKRQPRLFSDDVERPEIKGQVASFFLLF
jgi:hypothetical protein